MKPNSLTMQENASPSAMAHSSVTTEARPALPAPLDVLNVTP
jgi:hypothetical protein